MTFPNQQLVRLWTPNWTEVAAEFVHWYRGFRVDKQHPLAEPLITTPADWTFTVYSTDELVWKLDHWSLEDGKFTARCNPYLDITRGALKSDDYLTEAWLAAEKKLSCDEHQ